VANKHAAPEPGGASEFYNYTAGCSQVEPRAPRQDFFGGTLSGPTDLGCFSIKPITLW